MRFSLLPFLKVISLIDLQLLNALLPMDVTQTGITTEVMFEQDLNAFASIV